jgi:hypothetical protein
VSKQKGPDRLIRSFNGQFSSSGSTAHSAVEPLLYAEPSPDYEGLCGELVAILLQHGIKLVLILNNRLIVTWPG